jgi:hypothetical protein
MEIGKQNDIRWAKSKRQKLRHEYDSVSIILLIGLVHLPTLILFLHTCPSPTPSPINCMGTGTFFLHTFLGSQPNLESTKQRNIIHEVVEKYIVTFGFVRTFPLILLDPHIGRPWLIILLCVACAMCLDVNWHTTIVKYCFEPKQQ